MNPRTLLATAPLALALLVAGCSSSAAMPASSDGMSKAPTAMSSDAMSKTPTAMVAADEFRRMFDTGWRRDQARTPRNRAGSSGAGIGLAIVRAVVDAHSGTVGVTPTLGGCEVAVVLPAAASDTPPVGGIDGPPRVPGTTPCLIPSSGDPSGGA